MRITEKSAGFSLVELIIVILMVGIVGAVSMSRILRADAYNPIITREEIVSTLRMAQQRAIGHENVVVTLQPDGNALGIRITANGSDLRNPVTTPIRGMTLSADINNLASCGTTPPDSLNTLSDTKPLIVEFDALGDLLDAGVEEGIPDGPAPVDSGMRICLNDDPIMSICVSAAGYAYVGDCDG